MAGNPFTLPELGGSDSGELVAWLVEAGETVEDDQPVAEVETEKSVVEVPAPNAGTVTELLVDEGESVAVGEEILRIEGDESAGEPDEADSEAADSEAADSEPEPTDQPVEEVTISDERVFAPPRVRRLARELGVDISSVDGSGDSGRITEDDVRAAAESEAEAETGPKPFTPSGNSAVSKDDEAVSGAGLTEDGETGAKPFTPSGKSAVSKVSGAVDDAAAKTGGEPAQSTGGVAHATCHDTAVITELTDLRSELESHTVEDGVVLTHLPLVIKAVVRTLAAVPALNAAVDTEGEADDDYHIGIAVATDDGLAVPVVRNADEKTVLEIAAEIADLVERAEAGELTAAETEGGTFTMTVVGAIGDEYATLPVAESQTASLALGAIQPRPVVEDGAVVARETLPLSLAADSSVVDSTEAAAFIEQLVGYLESPNRLLLDAT